MKKFENLIYVNNEGREAQISCYACKAGTWYDVWLDYYNHKEFKTLKGAQRYLERNGYSIKA